MLNYKWGVIDFTGKVVLDIDYDYVQYGEKEFGLIVKNDKVGIIDEQCKIVLEPIFNYIDYFEKFNIAYARNSVWLLDKKFHKLLTFECDDIRVWGDIVIIVKNKKYGFVNFKTFNVLEPKYDYIDYFYNSYTKVNIGGKNVRRKIKGGKWGYINDNGVEIIPPIYDELCEMYDETGYKENPLIYFLRENLYGYINKTGDEVVKPIFEIARDFVEDRAAIKYKGYWGFIDVAGNIVIEAKYQQVKDFNNGLAQVKIKNKWVYIDTNGEEYFE